MNKRNSKQRSRARETQPSQRSPNSKLVPLSGLHAVDAVFRYNPSVVEEFYFSSEMADQVSDAANFLNSESKIATQIDDETLARLAGTQDHNGVVALTRRKAFKTISTKKAGALAKEGTPLIIVDGETSQDQIARLVRSAVYYGIGNIVLGESKISQINQANAYRAARGGLEMAEIQRTDQLPSFLKQIRSHYYILGSDYEGEKLLEFTALCPPEELGKPLAFALSASDQGLRTEVKEQCHTTVAIPGSDTLDRLGLASEAAILLQKYVAEGI